jgi:hypothetical protein
LCGFVDECYGRHSSRGLCATGPTALFVLDSGVVSAGTRVGIRLYLALGMSGRH